MDSSASADTGTAFKRSYVACLGCRSRKVRCVIEAEPPCARCKREHRECTFNDRTKTHKGRNPPKWAQSSKSRDISPIHNHAPSQRPVPKFANTPNRPGNPQTSPSTASDHMISTVTSGSADALNLLFGSARPDEPNVGRRERGERPRVNRSVEGMGFTITTLSDPEDDVLDMWDKCRFVRQGWFTAQEAVTYVDL